MPKHVVVLGGGVSGEAFIAALRRLDKEVRITLVEDELVGGECSYWACIPSRTLLRPVEIAFRAKSAHGVEAGARPGADLLVARQNAGPDDSSQVKWVEDLDAELVRGKGDRHGAGQARCGRERARIRRAHGLHGIPADAAADRGHRLRGALAEPRGHERQRGSRSLVVVGGGAVGCELAQFYARLGARVTIVQSGEYILPRSDREAGDLLGKLFRTKASSSA